MAGSQGANPLVGGMQKVSLTHDTHFPLVQSLRGLAALWVVLFHAEEGGHLASLTGALPSFISDIVFRAGHFGVPIFFALSGFVITHSIRGVEPTGATYGRFILRRSLRLDPPFWASIAFVVIMAFIAAQAKNETFSAPTTGTIVAHIFYLQQILGLDTINTVYWTLAYEVQFYAFFVGILTLAGRGKRAGRVVWISMFALAMAGAVHLLDGAPTGLFVNLWAAFFIGVMSYKALEISRARLPAILLGVTMFLFGGSFMAFSAAAAALLWLSGMSWLPWSATKLQWLGTISYSLYLFHNPLTGAASFIVHRILGSGVAADMAALIVILLVSITGAAAFWWLLERPSHRLSRLVSLRKSTIKLPAETDSIRI